MDSLVPVPCPPGSLKKADFGILLSQEHGLNTGKKKSNEYNPLSRFQTQLVILD